MGHVNIGSAFFHITGMGGRYPTYGGCHAPQLAHLLETDTSCYVSAPLFSESSEAGDKSQLAQLTTAELLAVMLYLGLQHQQPPASMTLEIAERGRRLSPCGTHFPKVQGAQGRSAWFLPRNDAMGHSPLPRLLAAADKRCVLRNVSRGSAEAAFGSSMYMKKPGQKPDSLVSTRAELSKKAQNPCYLIKDNKDSNYRWTVKKMTILPSGADKKVNSMTHMTHHSKTYT